MEQTQLILERLEKMEKANAERLDRIEQFIKEQVLLSKPVLNFEEAKTYLNLSESHIYKLTCKGKIPHSKPHGKLVYFDRQKLDAWRLSNPIITEKERDIKTSTYVTLNKAG